MADNKRGVATQALGYVEEKLRRVFKLAGPIGATLDPEVKPVIIVDDLRGPGHAFYQGRSWAITVAHLTIAAGTKAAGFVVSDDVVLEGFDIRAASSPANGALYVYIVTPDEQSATPPVGAVTNRTATWRDNKTVGTLLAASYDQPPIFGVSVFSALIGTGAGTGNIVWAQIGAGVPAPGFVPMPMYLPRGSGIYLQETNYTDLSFGVWGRVFPQ
jgi:hypothetical protein